MPPTPGLGLRFPVSRKGRRTGLRSPRELRRVEAGGRVCAGGSAQGQVVGGEGPAHWPARARGGVPRPLGVGTETRTARWVPGGRILMARWAVLGAHVAAFTPGERGPAPPPPPPGPPSGPRAFGLPGHRAPCDRASRAWGSPSSGSPARLWGRREVVRAPPPGGPPGAQGAVRPEPSSNPSHPSSQFLLRTLGRFVLKKTKARSKES